MPGSEKIAQQDASEIYTSKPFKSAEETKQDLEEVKAENDVLDKKAEAQDNEAVSEASKTKDGKYPSFLSSLNESQLIAHINTLSQLSQKEIQDALEDPETSLIQNSGPRPSTLDFRSIVGSSTPEITKKLSSGLAKARSDNPFLRSASSLASDPFDDDLDSQLLKLDAVNEGPSGIQGVIPASALSSVSSSGFENTPIPGNQLALFRRQESFESHKTGENLRGDIEENYGNSAAQKRLWSTVAETDESVHFEKGSKSPDYGNLHDHVGSESGTHNITENGDEIGTQKSYPEHETTDLLLSEDLVGLDMINTGTKNAVTEANSHSNFSDLIESDHIDQANVPQIQPRKDDSFLDEPEDPETSVFAEVGPQHEFGDYDTYFQNKYRKQQVADRDFIRWEKQRRVANGQSPDIPRVFAGCKIFVNGNTTPTLATIHKLVILYGGTFLSHLLNKGAATHIICDRLTPRKRVQFKNYRVVKAQWIVDCVEQEKLLDWKPYRLIDDIEPLQKRLGFSKFEGSGEAIEDESPEIEADQEEIVSEKTELGPGEIGTNVEFEDFGNLEDLDADAFDIENLGEHPRSPEIVENENEEPNPFLEPKPSVWETEDIGMDEPDTFSQSANVASAVASELELAKKDFTEMDIEKDSGAKSSDFSQLAVSKPRKAFAQMNAKHPDFLKHFFANSRLHHLSTWKADLKSKFLRLIARGYEGPEKCTSAQPVILHIDFDCFFATASALKHSSLDIKKDPIAVSHGGKSSDIASCNYAAREHGVSNGMWLGRALELCPNLKVIDYDFESYEKFSHAFYSYLISRKAFDSIFPVSIDEVLVDATSHCHGENLVGKVNGLCEEIRRDIFSLTNCPVSVGASSNVLLAKLAIRKAKPDGHFYLYENIQEFLDKTDVRQLPGIGKSLTNRLSEELGHSELHPVLIGEVKKLFSERLIKVFGEKTGLKIHDYCHGRDSTSIQLDLNSSEVLLGRKTVSVDVNYGIRFDLFSEVENFLISLAKELHSRLIDLGACGSSITLRLAKRAPDAPVITPKFMGLGKCIFVSRSSSLGVATNDWGIIGSEMKALFRTFNIPPQDLRGIAVSLSKLEDVEAVKKQRQQKLVLTRKAAAQREKPPLMMSQKFPFAERVTGVESVDWDVFNQLPDEIRRELKKELLRRGIPVSSKERSPTKKPSEGGAKVYLQQMFPTQPHGEFKVKRVIESPTKKKKTESPKKSMGVRQIESPVRVPYNETVSYDEDVLNEIPSSIRNEFMEELEWQKKNKQLGFVSMKTKIERKQQLQKKIREQVVDDKWLQAQPRLKTFQSFNDSIYNYHDLVEQLRRWVSSTTEEEGPHPDDVTMFENYLQKLFEQSGITRIMNLLKAMTSELQLQESLVKLCAQSEEQKTSIKEGIKDWQTHMTRIKAKFEKACANIGIFV